MQTTTIFHPQPAEKRHALPPPRGGPGRPRKKPGIRLQDYERELPGGGGERVSRTPASSRRTPQTQPKRSGKTLAVGPPEKANPPPPTQSPLVTEAKTSAVKRRIKEQKENTDKLDSLIQQSHEILFHCTSVFPFDFFNQSMCELSIEPTQINILQKQLFSSGQISSVPIKNIADVVVETSPWFSTITLTTTTVTLERMSIPYIKQQDAKKIHQILQGLSLATKEGVDLSTIPLASLKKKMQELGKVRAIGKA